MKVNYDIEVPQSDKEDMNILYKFAESEHKTMMISYDNEEEASRRASVLRSANSRNKWGMAFKRLGVDVYIEK